MKSMGLTPYKGIPVNCIFCIYEIHPLPHPWKSIGNLRRAKFVISTENGYREVCQSHALKGKWDKDWKGTILVTFNLQDIGDRETVIAFFARKDGLYDLVHHPRGYVKFGLSKRERDAFATANPKYSVREIEEGKPYVSQMR